MYIWVFIYIHAHTHKEVGCKKHFLFKLPAVKSNYGLI